MRAGLVTRVCLWVGQFSHAAGGGGGGGVGGVGRRCSNPKQGLYLMW